MTKMNFGVLIHATPRKGTVPAMRTTNERLLQEAEKHNLSVWFIDHFQIEQQPLLECFAFVAHTMARYPTLTAGTLVLGQGYRNPALTAKIASTLQFLTDNRFILGIGAGWKEDEFRAYGYPFPPARERITQLSEAVQIIRKMWEPGTATFDGEYYQVHEAQNDPKSQPAPRLMIGGGGEQRTLRVVAEYADWWNADYYTAADYGRKLERLRQYCREFGRPEEAVVPTYYAGISLSNDPSKVVKQPPVVYRKEGMFVFHGNPDEVSQQIEEFAALGVQQIQINFLDFPGTEGIDLFFSEVLPRFQ